MKKITLATVKSFIKKNEGCLFIRVKSKFDGMTDGLEYFQDGFRLAEETDVLVQYTLGIKDAWFVGSSRDHLSPFETEHLTGIEVSNCCGRFILAIQK